MSLYLRRTTRSATADEERQVEEAMRMSLAATPEVPIEPDRVPEEAKHNGATSSFVLQEVGQGLRVSTKYACSELKDLVEVLVSEWMEVADEAKGTQFLTDKLIGRATNGKAKMGFGTFTACAPLLTPPATLREHQRRQNEEQAIRSAAEITTSTLDTASTSTVPALTFLSADYAHLRRGKLTTKIGKSPRKILFSISAKGTYKRDSSVEVLKPVADRWRAGLQKIRPPASKQKKKTNTRVSLRKQTQSVSQKQRKDTARTPKKANSASKIISTPNITNLMVASAKRNGSGTKRKRLIKKTGSSATDTDENEDGYSGFGDTPSKRMRKNKAIVAIAESPTPVRKKLRQRRGKAHRVGDKTYHWKEPDDDDGDYVEVAPSKRSNAKIYLDEPVMEIPASQTGSNGSMGDSDIPAAITALVQAQIEHDYNLRLRQKVNYKRERIIKQPATILTTRNRLRTSNLPKRTRFAADFFSNRMRFRFGIGPFEDWPGPETAACKNVFEILREHHRKDGVALERDEMPLPGAPQGPMHASESFTIDALVKTIMSQNTDNNLALVAQESLRLTYQYTVNGQQVPGSIPNYHRIRTSSVQKLETAIKAAGQYVKRAKRIKQILDLVYDENMQRVNEGKLAAPEHLGNSLEAPDFVPGMLSLDHMYEMEQQEQFDYLVNFEGIGTKTAACILSFNLRRPVFAVDTHVHRLVTWLGWVPLGCSANDAFAILDRIIDNDIKFGLHQAFWQHGQLCRRCQANVTRKTEGWEQCVCPIEHLIENRFAKPPPPLTPSPKARNVRKEESDTKEESSTPKQERKPRVKNFGTRLTLEEALSEGFSIKEIAIDDAFGVTRSNYKAVPKRCFVRTKILEDGEVEVDWAWEKIVKVKKEKDASPKKESQIKFEEEGEDEGEEEDQSEESLVGEDAEEQTEDDASLMDDE